MNRFVCLLLLLGVSSAFANENWPQFRGARGDGESSSRNLPVKWSEDSNVTWKTPIHGRGWCSPVIWGNQVWLTTATPDGKELSGICVDKESGKVLFDKKLFHVEEPQFAHKFNSYASPSPVIEEGFVYLTFGSPGTACIDTRTFETVWTRRDLECDHWRGSGSSPILFKDLLIMHFDGADVQYVVALNKKTGKTVWKTKRSVEWDDIEPDGSIKGDGDLRKAYATPQIIWVNKTPVLVSIAAKATYGYDAGTGKEIWRVEEKTSHSGSTRPVVDKDRIYLSTGFPRGQLWALPRDLKGTITAENAVWTEKRGVPKKPSMILVGGTLYMVDDGGIGTCRDAATGEEIWKERIGGNFSASPVYGEGRIYFCNEAGETSVVEASREFKVLSVNKLEDGFMASPAISGSSLFLRSTTHLYRIDSK